MNLRIYEPMNWWIWNYLSKFHRFFFSFIQKLYSCLFVKTSRLKFFLLFLLFSTTRVFLFNHKGWSYFAH